MKILFSFLWTAILLISVLASCTIEKRLYQPGHHVEWNKRARSVNGTEIVTEKQASDQVISADEKNTEMIAPIPAIEETTMAEERTTVLSQTQDRVSNTSKNSTVTNTTNSDQQTETLDQSHEVKSVLKKASQREGSNGFTRGLLVILTGLLLIGLGFLFNSILGSVFGTIFLIIFGLGGSIMIVVGIVMLVFA